jgi:hypothetical protein
MDDPVSLFPLDVKIETGYNGTASSRHVSEGKYCSPKTEEVMLIRFTHGDLAAPSSM